MNFRTIIACVSVLGLTVAAFPAEDQVQQLQLQLKQMQDEFEKTRRQQQQQIDALTQKLDALTNAAAVAVAPVPLKMEEQKKLEQ